MEQEEGMLYITADAELDMSSYHWEKINDVWTVVVTTTSANTKNN